MALPSNYNPTAEISYTIQWAQVLRKQDVDEVVQPKVWWVTQKVTALVSGQEVALKTCGRLDTSSKSKWEPNWHWSLNVILISRENTILMETNNFNAGRHLVVITSYLFILWIEKLKQRDVRGLFNIMKPFMADCSV